MDDVMTVLRALMPQGSVVSVQVVTLGDEAAATNYTYEGSGSLRVIVDRHYQEVVASDHVFGQVQYALALSEEYSRPEVDEYVYHVVRQCADRERLIGLLNIELV